MYDHVVGHIERRSAAAAPQFTYSGEYADTTATPLSVRMPVADTTYSGKSVHAFLEGVLPEDPQTRQRWGTRFGVDPSDSIALLSGMGWDCPGAVQFCQPDALEEMRSRSQEFKPVTGGDIAARIRALRTGDAASWSLPDEHWSLPGQQSKFALAKLPDGWHEAHGSAATTHIVKPGIGRMHHQALVEHVTMEAASAVGVVVAKSTFTRFDDQWAIVIDRFDRSLAASRVLRTHQEDFAQACGRMPAHKYESRNGPGLADMMRVITRESTGLFDDRLALADSSSSERQCWPKRSRRRSRKSWKG
jgi:serine/threonine-protein kinase HipA